MGNVAADSQLDLLLSCSPSPATEVLHSLICKLTNPLVASSHDILISEVTLELSPTSPLLPNLQHLLPTQHEGKN